MFLWLFYLISCNAQFNGNRTHYPNLKPRPEAKIADPYFEINGTGIVNILNPYSRSISPNTASLQQMRSLWASQNGVRILYRSYNEAETYDDYVYQVKLACNFSEQTSFDILWINSTVASDLSDCLLDLYAWDFDMAKEIDPNLVYKSIVNNRLVTLPAEPHLGALVGNSYYLETYGYTDIPKSLDEMQAMCEKILMNEKPMENWYLTCFSGPFGDREALTGLTNQWIASYNGSIFTEKNITVASAEAMNALTRILNWADSRYIDSKDISGGTVESSLQKFKDRKSVFLFVSLSEINHLIKNPPNFEWKIIPWPSVNGDFVGNLGGWSLGIYKYTKNPTAAVKTVKWLVSREAQRRSIALSNPIKLLPIYPDLYKEGEVCDILGYNICEIFSQVKPLSLPSTIVGRNYQQVSFLISSTTYDILNGNTDITSGLENLYFSLRSLLRLNGAKSDFTSLPPRPIRKGFAYLTLQVWILFLVIAFIMGATILYRLISLRIKQKQELETPSTDGQKQVSKEDGILNRIMKSVGLNNNGKFQKLKQVEEEQEHMEEIVLQPISHLQK